MIKNKIFIGRVVADKQNTKPKCQNNLSSLELEGAYQRISRIANQLEQVLYNQEKTVKENSKEYKE